MSNFRNETEAPGLRRRARKGGDAWYWVATAVSRRASDYPLKTIRLTETTDEARAARCRALTAELQEWLSGRETDRPFDGTMGSLIHHYRTTAESPYAMVQENTRGDYDDRLTVLERSVSQRVVANLIRVDFVRWHRNFMAPLKDGGQPRVRRAHGAMAMVRMLLSFGVSMGFTSCAPALAVISEMNFEAPKKRTQALTFDQAERIIDLALAGGRRSLALGQALQFELMMRQVDVIGKWTVAGDAAGGIVYRGNRWGGGVLWSDVTPDLTISKVTTKTAATGEWDLREYPLVMKVLAHYPAADRVGPMVVSERTGIPYDLFDYGQDWRPFADAAGVPRNVWNRDSRAGGITEGWDANADEKDLQRAATHSTPAMTRQYARNSLASTKRVARARVAGRKRDGNAP